MVDEIVKMEKLEVIDVLIEQQILLILCLFNFVFGIVDNIMVMLCNVIIIFCEQFNVISIQDVCDFVKFIFSFYMWMNFGVLGNFDI